MTEILLSPISSAQGPDKLINRPDADGMPPTQSLLQSRRAQVAAFRELAQRHPDGERALRVAVTRLYRGWLLRQDRAAWWIDWRDRRPQLFWGQDRYEDVIAATEAELSIGGPPQSGTAGN